MTGPLAAGLNRSVPQLCLSQRVSNRRFREVTDLVPRYPSAWETLAEIVPAAREPHRVRQLVGVTGQYASVDEDLTATENLWLFGRLQGLRPADARATAKALLEQFGLEEAADRPIAQFSGGMRRRLDLAASLITRPPLIFLDEPTTGLDPRTRGQMWDTIRGLVADGCTVLLTTQYLDEADQLADRISVLDNGRVVAEGTPDDLKSDLGGDRLDVVLHDVADLAAAAATLAAVTGADPATDPDRRLVSASVRDRVATLTEATRALQEKGVNVEDVALRRPTLDEVYLHLTGHHTEEVPA